MLCQCYICNYVCDIACSDPPTDDPSIDFMVTDFMLDMLQKLYASLEEKELLPETSISASDEYQYESAIYTFEQYGDSLKYIEQINTHGYHSKACAHVYPDCLHPRSILGHFGEC